MDYLEDFYRSNDFWSECDKNGEHIDLIHLILKKGSVKHHSNNHQNVTMFCIKYDGEQWDLKIYENGGGSPGYYSWRKFYLSIKRHGNNCIADIPVEDENEEGSDIDYDNIDINNEYFWNIEPDI